MGFAINVFEPLLSFDGILPVIGAGIVLGLALLVLPHTRIFRKGRLATAFSLLICSFSTLAGWAGWQEEQLTKSSVRTGSRDAANAMHGSKASVIARTDRGRVIRLDRVEKSENYHGVLEQEERQLSQNSYGSSFKRTANPTPESNCHGWVFADGHYWIDGDEVDPILEDNGYTQVSTPQSGDLIVYRTGDAVSHVGLVRTVAANGLLVVESKWGSKGRFLHTPEDQPYWHSWGFYRSPRQGHQLKGIHETPAESSPAQTDIVSLPGTKREG